MRRLLFFGVAVGVLALGLFGSAALAATSNPALIQAKWWHRKASHHPHVKGYHKPKQRHKHHTTYRT